MNRQNNLDRNFSDWITAALEGSASEEIMAALSREIVINPAARDYYIKVVAVHAHLAKVVDLSLLRDASIEIVEDAGEAFREVIKRDLEDSSIRKSLCELEPEGESGLRNKALAPVRVRISTRELRNMLIRTAAVLLLCLGVLWFDRAVQHAAQQRDHFIVARLTEQVGAQWDPVLGPFNVNDLIWNGDYRLDKGQVELKTIKGARVLIEGPAVFSLVTDDNMIMRQGKLYASVPQRAIGFTVNTPNAKVIDLGTEFGIEINNINDDMQLHVIQGKTTLIAGSNESRTSLPVSQDSAMKVTGSNGQVTVIDCEYERFIRRINTATGTIWRGQSKFDLADVVGGGNGFGTGVRESGLHTFSGTVGAYIDHDRVSDNRYRLVPAVRYIDGVFVPNGEYKQYISSRGHVFWDCPITNSICGKDLINGRGLAMGDYTEYPDISNIDSNSRLFIHSNLGITYDLDAIRADIPGTELTCFSARAGISDNSPRIGNAEMWVLIDGQVRFTQRFSEVGQLEAVNIELKPYDRFLTLISTDGGATDPQQPDSRPETDSDWCVFDDPYLKIEPVAFGNSK